MTITTHERDDITIVTIDRPPVNALDVETLNEISDAFDGARGAGKTVVLTGEGSIFSAGADLQRVLAAPDEYVDAGIDALTRCFRTLFLFPRPVVAAVNGAALAGGAVLACACDYRVADSAAPIGVIELRAGVPFPAWALEVVRYAVRKDRFQEIVYLAGAYRGEDARAVGLVDEVVDGSPMERALEVAQRLAQIPLSSFSLTKRSMRSAVVAHADELARTTDDDIKEAWRSDAVKSAIRAQLERIAKR